MSVYVLYHGSVYYSLRALYFTNTVPIICVDHSVISLNEVTESQQTRVPLELHSRALLNPLSSCLRSSPNTNETSQPQKRSRSSVLRPDAVLVRLSSLFRSSPDTNETIELPERPTQSTFCSRSPHVELTS
jgi:hypothetical protein